jgi:hypothetical protein
MAYEKMKEKSNIIFLGIRQNNKIPGYNGVWMGILGQLNTIHDVKDEWKVKTDPLFLEWFYVNKAERKTRQKREQHQLDEQSNNHFQIIN